MRLARPGCGALLGLVVLVSGCNMVGAITYLFSPRQIQKTEFALTRGRLALVIEASHPGQDNPVFTQALHEKLVEVFRDKKINDQVVPREELLRVQRANPDYARWSLQKIGRALSAEQVLYVRLESLRVRAAPDHPLVEPEARLRLKVIAVDEMPETARLWPPRQERDGREVECSRHARQATGPMAVDAEAVKLAKDAAHLLAMPFYDVDLEEKPPREP